MLEVVVAVFAEAVERLQLLAASNIPALELALRFFPIVLLLELPLFIVLTLGVLRWAARERSMPPKLGQFRPRVSCVVTCYDESDASLRSCVTTLLEQVYTGHVEIVAVVDGAFAQRRVYETLTGMQAAVSRYPGRSLRVLPKWQRGGRVSSLNAGLDAVSGEFLVVADADTSFDNDMIFRLIRHFRDPSVIGVSGTLRARNHAASITTRFQSIEYMLSIQTSRIGLAEWNMLNNISGAFGAFRVDVLRRLGGWDTHSAEDLDLTIRLKSLFGRHPHLRLVFEPHATAHTDVPDTWSGFFRQRLRWDGDLFFMYIRKHFTSLAGNAVGWRNLLGTVFYSLFFQILVPLLLLIYLVWAMIVLTPGQFLFTVLLVYLLYATKTLILYSIHQALVSDRPRSDLRYAWLLPAYPIFAFSQRIWSAVAILNEILRRGHLETTMAPWWVLKRGKRF